MMRWPSSPEFREDPLRWLVRAGSEPGVISLPSAGGRLDEDGEHVYAAFGAQASCGVLSDLSVFAMPRSLAERHGLPQVLANLNSALFSMTGNRHREHRRLLAYVLGSAGLAEQHAAIERGVAAFADDLAFDVDFQLMEQTRRLARLVAQEVMFGLDASHERLGIEIQQLFELRRIANTQVVLDRDLRCVLVDQGTVVDGILRELIGERRRRPASRPGVLSELILESTRRSEALSDDELVAHANILFMSSSEPIATALAWTLLAVTQLPTVVSEIRCHLVAGSGQSSLLMGVVQEVLRLAPPSAVLIRVTQRDTVLGGHSLAAGQAVLVSPFVEHRRESTFRDASMFRPSRWETERPGPYEFLPFGGGARSCLGRRIALATLYQAVRAVLLRGDVVIPIAQIVDWRLNVTLQPYPDPTLRLVRAGGATPGQDATWTGPSTEILPTAQDPSRSRD